MVDRPPPEVEGRASNRPVPLGVSVGFSGLERERAERLLRSARDAAGLAAFHYFFRDSTPAAKAAYLSAIEAEAEAELLARDVAGNAS